MMTDKEQIICHGVDVSKCDRLNLNSAYGWDDPDMCSIPCCKNAPNCLFKQLARKTQECEELKKQLMQKDEINTFFNTPIEGWSSDPCGICESKNNYEQLKQE